jgi:acyl dehydratase
MVNWDKQLYLEDVEVESQLYPVSIPLSLQRLVMEAGANRDLSSIHHDREAAVATGAPDVYMNTYFILGMFERLLREWMGLRGTIKRIGSLRMKVFNCVGDTVTYKGKVREKHEADGTVVLDIWCETQKGQTVTAEATVVLPIKG